MNLSPYVANALARWLCGETMPSAPGDLYLALFSGDPLDGGVEVGGDITGADARVLLSLITPANDGSSNVVVSNTETSFGASVSVSPIVVSHIAVYDDATSGNMIGCRQLEVPRTINENDNVRVLSGEFSFIVEKFGD